MEISDGAKSCGLLRRSFSVAAQIRTGGIAGIRGANEEETPAANEGGATVFDGDERDAGGGVVRPNRRWWATLNETIFSR